MFVILESVQDPIENDTAFDVPCERLNVRTGSSSGNVLFAFIEKPGRYRFRF